MNLTRFLNAAEMNGMKIKAIELTLEGENLVSTILTPEQIEMADNKRRFIKGLQAKLVAAKNAGR